MCTIYTRYTGIICIVMEMCTLDENFKCVLFFFIDKRKRSWIWPCLQHIDIKNPGIDLLVFVRLCRCYRIFMLTKNLLNILHNGEISICTSSIKLGQDEGHKGILILYRTQKNIQSTLLLSLNFHVGTLGCPKLNLSFMSHSKYSNTKPTRMGDKISTNKSNLYYIIHAYYMLFNDLFLSVIKTIPNSML